MVLDIGQKQALSISSQLCLKKEFYFDTLKSYFIYFNISFNRTLYITSYILLPFYLNIPFFINRSRESNKIIPHVLVH